MKKIEQVSIVVKETQDIYLLIRRLLMCFDSINEEQCEELMQQIEAKLKEFKDENKNNQQASTQRSINSARLAAMGQMAAAISHELRNPLSGIKVTAEYLMRKLKNQPESIDAIVNIHNEVIFANNIITNILEHARIGLPKLEKISIKRIIEEAILTMAQQGSFNNIKIEKRIPGELPLLLLDSLQIRQVFMNLFINSAEAMLGGGILTVKGRQKQNDVVIKVSDTGTGIEKTHLEKLFEPFFSTKVKGIGLGLAIAKEIIENHEGAIEVESKPDRGTTFTITLPIPKLKRADKKKSRS